MDYYRILGVPKNATQEQIKQAFREKAKRYHPDVNPEGQTFFKKILEAYETLSNPEKRKAYDQQITTFSTFKELLKVKPTDIKLKLEISLEEAFNGTDRWITFDRRTVCNICNGEGVYDNSTFEKCEKCKGRGYLEILGIKTVCFDCKGEGSKLVNPCPLCKGRGVSEKAETLKVKIPAGTKQTRFIFKGLGNETPTGESGNLIVNVSLRKHPFFTLKGTDLICKLYLTEDMINRGYITIYNLKGEKIKVQLPEGVDKNTILRVKEEGFIRPDGTSGDILIKLN